MFSLLVIVAFSVSSGIRVHNPEKSTAFHIPDGIDLDNMLPNNKLLSLCRVLVSTPFGWRAEAREGDMYIIFCHHVRISHPLTRIVWITTQNLLEKLLL